MALQASLSSLLAPCRLPCRLSLSSSLPPAPLNPFPHHRIFPAALDIVAYHFRQSRSPICTNHWLLSYAGMGALYFQSSLFNGSDPSTVCQ